jgi:hypothetical protein
MFLVVSSHDFENSESHADLSHGQDWGVFQIKNSFDMSFVGNRYVDCFLTGGLGCHRVHHVLPSQKSGFANIVCEPAVRKTCEEFDLTWTDTKNFIIDRVPKLFSFYVFAPMRLQTSQLPVKNGWIGIIHEAFSLSALKTNLSFIVLGFWGVGSI